MAVLGQIRKRPWVLISFVTIALLAFLINPESINKVFGKDPNILGKVNGEEITRDEYNDQLMLMQQEFQQRGYPIQGLEERAWQTLVQFKLIKQQFEKMGLKITEDVFWNQLQFDPSFAQNSQNFDDKGNFKTQEVRKQIENLQKTGDIEQANYWFRKRKSIEYEIMLREVLTSIFSGVTGNNKEDADNVKLINENADIDFVRIDYETFGKKNPVKVSTQDLSNFMKKYPNSFKVQESRNLGIVHFKADPSSEDEQKTLSEINKLYTEGIDSGDGIESLRSNKNDSMFVMIHSDIGYNPRFFSEEQFPVKVREWIGGASIGDTFGPYKEQGYYIVSKLLAKKANDSTRSKHILISYKGLPTAEKNSKRTKEGAKILAEKIYTEVRANSSKFSEYLKLSADGSSENGGDLGWTTISQPKFIPQFQNFVDKSPKGAIGLVESQFGYHIIVITDKKSGVPVYKVANLAKAIRASDVTTGKVHASSTAFIQRVQGKSFNDFSNLAKKNNYNFSNLKLVQRFQGFLRGIETDKDVDILKWAFDKKRNKGDVDIFTASNGDRIVVYLSGKQNAGTEDPESAREQIELTVRNQLLAKKIVEKIDAAKAGSLDAIAKLFAVTKESGKINFLNPVLGNMIMEPKLAGAAFSVGVNKISKPIEGNTGVFVVLNKGISQSKQSGDVNQMMEKLKQQNQNTFRQMFMKNLMDNADIKDYRIEVYDKSYN